MIKKKLVAKRVKDLIKYSDEEIRTNLITHHQFEKWVGQYLVVCDIYNLNPIKYHDDILIAYEPSLNDYLVMHYLDYCNMVRSYLNAGDDYY